jgi:hypothetical protein
MCHTTVQEDMPLTTAGPGLSSAGAPADLNEGVPGYDADAVNAIAGNNGAPKSVSVRKPTKFGRLLEIASLGDFDPAGDMQPGSPSHKLTKFGALMQVLQPALEGGIIGLAGGKGTPGGGFNAANEFFMRRNALNFQRAMLERQFANDQFRNLLEYARTQHTLNQPYFSGARGTVVKGTDANGNPVVMRPNPYTGVYEPIPGITPESNESFRPEMTDQGLVTVSTKTGEVRRASLPLLPPDSSATGNIAPSKFDSGSPRIPRKPGASAASVSPGASPSAIAVGGGIPLRPAGFSKPAPRKVTNRNATGFETDSLIDENPNSPTYGQTLRSNIASRAPLPDRTEGLEDARQAAANDLSARIESYAAEALKRSGNDPDKAVAFMNGLKVGDPKAQQQLQSLLPKIRQRIRDRARTSKKSNPFGLSDQDWQSLTGGQAQQDQPEQ